MSEYVPIDIDDVVHMTDNAVLVRGHFWDPEKNRIGSWVSEKWIPLSVLEFGDSYNLRDKTCEVRVLHIAEWWAERERFI